MSQRSKGFCAFVITVLLIGASAPAALAESQTENSFTGFFKRLFNYPGKAVKETAGMTANTLNNTGEKVVAKTGENTAAVLTGDLAKTGNLVVDPVIGTAETVGQTASETAQIPVKAAEEETQQ